MICNIIISIYAQKIEIIHQCAIITNKLKLKFENKIKNKTIYDNNILLRHHPFIVDRW